MVAKRTRLTKQERAERDGLMRCVELAHIKLLRHMIDLGWSDTEIVAVYRRSLSACAEMVVAPDNWTPDEVAMAVFRRHFDTCGGE